MHMNSMFPLPKAWLKNPTHVTMGLLGQQGGGNKTTWQLFLFQDPLDRDPPSAVCSICYYNPTLLSDLQTLLSIRAAAHLLSKKCLSYSI